MATLRRFFSRRTLAYLGATTLGVAGGGYYYLNSGPPYPASTRETRRPPPPWTPPPRQAMLDALEKSGSHSEEQFDLLIVGGGATGAGVAVDAASRGLRVALVERGDFSSGEYAVAIWDGGLVCIYHADRRYIFKIDQVGPWWGSVPPESRHGARLRAVQACARSLARTEDIPPDGTLLVAYASHHVAHLQVRLRLVDLILELAKLWRGVGIGKCRTIGRGVRCMTYLPERKTWRAHT